MHFPSLSTLIVPLIVLCFSTPLGVAAEDPLPPGTPITIPGRKEFVSLHAFIKSFLQTTPRGIQNMLRASFHDLMNFNPAASIGAGHGCLVETLATHPSNAGLTMATDLVKAVRSKFPAVAYTNGDILSLAGKSAVELALPGVTVPWGFGRRSCAEFKPEVPSPPPQSIRTMSAFQPFLTRYGFTWKDMAILTIGAHGISGAQNRQPESGVFSFTFARVSSGTEFIRTTLSSLGWQFFNNGGPTDWYGLKQPAPNGPTSANNIGRFPSDMVFFPSVVRQSGGVPDGSATVSSTETQLRQYVSLPNSAFDQDFVAVFARMLRIGSTNLTAF